MECSAWELMKYNFVLDINKTIERMASADDSNKTLAKDRDTFHEIKNILSMWYNNASVSSDVEKTIIKNISQHEKIIIGQYKKINH